MELFDGFGLTVEGPMTADAVSYAHRIAYLTRSEADARGLLAYRKYLELPDGGFAYAIKHGDLVRVRIVPAKKDEYETPLSITYPDFASGIHTTARITVGSSPTGPVNVVTGFYPTSGTQNRLNISSGPQTMERFAVDLSSDRDDLKGMWAASPLQFAQHGFMISSLFSGRMVKLVQGLLGFGKFKSPSAFQQVLKIEETDAEEYLKSLTYHELATFLRGLQVQYDNRFYRTHGVVAGGDGKWYIAQISPSGVLIMPMRYWRGTDKLEFREYVEEEGDYEAIEFLDTFGGFPTGEPFPAIYGGVLDAAIRAGFVKRLKTDAEVATAYAHQPFSTGMGWAFNQSGTEAHNVMYEYGADDFMYTQHFHFQFGGISEMPPQTGDEHVALQTELKALLTNQGPTTPDYRWFVMSKLPWLSESTLRALVAQAKGDPAAAFTQLDAETVTRVTGSVGMGASARNKVWYPGKNLAAPPMKFHEPLLPGLMNVDLRKLGFQYGNYNYPVVQDCMMHVYFIGDQLKYVKWYSDLDVKTFNEVTNDYEDCMWQGSWTQTELYGSTELGPGFYHSDNDPRFIPAPTEITTKIKSKYLREDQYVIGDDPAWPSRCWGTRTHTFDREEERTTEHGKGYRIACIVPRGTREGVLFAWADERQSTGVLWMKTWPKMLDPWWFECTRLFGKINPGPSFGGGWLPTSDKCGWWHTDRRIVITNYSPTLCSDIVDEGPWFSECDTVDNWPQGPDRPQTTVSSTSYDQIFHVFADYPPMGGMKEVYKHTWKPTAENPYYPWDANWFYPSPDEYGNIQQCGVLWNGFGDSDLVIGDTGPSGYGPGIFEGSPSREVFRGTVAFVGVVDGSP